MTTTTNTNEKNYRVIFKKNLGHGKRTRIPMKANTLSELLEDIAAKAKEERLRPMRIQEMDGTTCINKYRIVVVDNQLDVIRSKERQVSTKTEVTAPIEEVEEVVEDEFTENEEVYEFEID